MTYIQIETPNYNIPYVGGLCEGYVEGTVGQATLPNPTNQTTIGVYPSAIAAWNANQGNHSGELPPQGFYTPVYFTLGNNKYGHTAVALPDGRIASSTLPGYHSSPYIHKNLQDLIDVYGRNNGGCTYLGWREYIGKLQVVKGGRMSDKIEGLELGRLVDYFFVGRNGTHGKPNALKGEDDDQIKQFIIGNELNIDYLRGLYNTPEVQEFIAFNEKIANGGIANTDPIVELQPGTYKVK